MATEKDNKVMQLYYDYTDELIALCSNYKLDLSVVLAIIHVESSDEDGFSDDGKVIIRFEAHKFYKYCSPKVLHIAESCFRWNEEKPWKDQEFRAMNVDRFMKYHGNQDKEYDVLHFCIDIDRDAAFKSISMGLPQIMGFNHNRLGYATAELMMQDFVLGTMQQIEAMFRFFDYPMLYALRTANYEVFARGYNGSGQAIRYGGMIKDAVKVYDNLIYN